MSEMPDARNLTRAELRKAIVRLRLEMQRQQLRQEGELLLQPLKQARHVGQSLRGGLAGNIPLWGAGGAAALALLFGRKRRWIRLLRLGIALAPVIRGEVRREPVRWLRKVLGNGYLLAIDRTVWDARVDHAVHARLAADWQALSAHPAFLVDAAPLSALLDQQGRSELEAWAGSRNPALAEWARLLHGEAPPRQAYLPDKALLRVLTHHENRD